jgi:hypothetical protein
MSSLPPLLSGNLVAALTGHSPRYIRRLIDQRELHLVAGRITLASVERYLGREISLNDYGAAKAAIASKNLTCALRDAPSEGPLGVNQPAL